MMTIGCKDGCFYNHVGGERRMFAWDEGFSRGLAVPILCTTTVAEVDNKKDEYQSSLGQFGLEIWRNIWSPMWAARIRDMV